MRRTYPAIIMIAWSGTFAKAKSTRHRFFRHAPASINVPRVNPSERRHLFLTSRVCPAMHSPDP
jgi:hypothetical protein